MTPVPPVQPAPVRWRPRPEAELFQDQVAAIDAWTAARRVEAERARGVAAASREARLDLARRSDVLRCQHEALVARTAAQLRDSARLLRTVSPPRAVVVHRDDWFRDKVCAALVEGGVEVVVALTNGAEAVGAVVAEQPDLLLVEDRLPMLGGASVLRQSLPYAPRTLAAAHVDGEDQAAGLLAAGAIATFARRTPPGEVARDLCGRVQG